MQTIIPPNTLTRPHPGSHPGHAPSDASDSSPDLAENFRAINTRCATPNGINPVLGIRCKNDGLLDYLCTGDDRGGATELGARVLFARVRALIADPLTEELVFGFDRAGGPREYTTRPRFLTVHYYHRDRGWRFGLVEYTPQPWAADAIRWDHPFHAKRLCRETHEGLHNLTAKEAA